MEQSTEIETLETSLLANIWAERLFIEALMIPVVLGIYAHFNLPHFNLLEIFELMAGSFFFIGIVFLGFVGIAAHVRYYFKFERDRKLELYKDRMVICVNNQVVGQILKNDISKITLYDKRHVDVGNLFPTLLDSFYYLVVTGKNQERVVLTCLLDIRLKKKITAWYGQEPEHIYQFFPFPSSNVSG